MWLGKLKPLGVIAAALILTTAGVAVHGRQKPMPEATPKQAKAAPAPAAAALPALTPNQAIARKQLALIDNAWEMSFKLAQNARIEIASGPLSQWGRRRLETLHKAGAGKAEIVKALEGYIDSLKLLEGIAEARRNAARATMLEVFEVQYLRMEAEIWLNEEKAR